MTKDLSQDCFFYFISLMEETNADTFKMKMEKVEKEGKMLGDYELIIKKRKNEKNNTN